MPSCVPFFNNDYANDPCIRNYILFCVVHNFIYKIISLICKRKIIFSSYSTRNDHENLKVYIRVSNPKHGHIY